MDRRSLIVAGLVTSMAGRAEAQTPPPVSPKGEAPGLSQPTQTIDLWPGTAPGAPRVALVETVDERSADPLLNDRVVHGISCPRLTVFRPDFPNGAAALIIPGGGYKWVVIDKEGYEMARWLSARGFTAFVLFYRLPGDGWAAGPNVALADAQRAMRLIRHRAREFRIDPERVVAMGFSAGGHVCASLATRFADHVYAPVDKADTLSAKPHSAAPIYPVVSMDSSIAHMGSRDRLIGSTPSESDIRAQSPDQNVPADAPPHFLLHAEDDDAVPVANTLRLHAALRAARIPVEMHLFAQGGHGFGLRKAIGKPVEVWPDLWRAWARTLSLG
jgi:acetyl esterase/lipase